MRTVFSESYHIPVLMLLVTASAIAIEFRVITFQRSWRSMPGIGVILSVSAGVFALVYAVCSIVMFSINQMLFRLFDTRTVPPAYQNTPEYPFPLDLTDPETAWVKLKATPLINLSVASRLFLAFALWTVKWSLFVVYIPGAQENRFSRRRWFLHGTGTILAISTVIAVSISFQGLFKAVEYPMRADEIRQGYLLYGVDYPTLEDSTEILIGVMNLFTDLLLVVLAYNAVRSLRYPARAAWLIFTMGSITILTALIRLIIILYTSYNCDEKCQGDMDRVFSYLTPIMVMTEFETFISIIVSCLPALRAAKRAVGTPKGSAGNSSVESLPSGLRKEYA